MTSLEKGLDHLLKCSQNATSRGHCALALEDARLLLHKLRCVAFLGGGTFGAVFETTSGQAVKFVPQRRSQSLLPSGAQQEFHMHKAFASCGLASRPSAFQHFQSSVAATSGTRQLPAEISALCMPKIAWTLDSRLQVGDISPSLAADLGRRLVRLLAAARAAGLVHHDAKCNNLSASADLADLHFIDFGRAFDERDLLELGVGTADAAELVCLGTALDAWRLQESLFRKLDRIAEGKWTADEKAAVMAPLQAFALKLLKKCRAVAKASQPVAAWWQDAAVFQNLKSKFAKHLQQSLRSHQPGLAVRNSRQLGERA